MQLKVSYTYKVFALLSLLFMAAGLAVTRMVSAPGEATYWIAATDTPMPTSEPQGTPLPPVGYCYGDPSQAPPPDSGCMGYVAPPDEAPTATPMPTPTPFVLHDTYFLGMPVSIADGAFLRVDELQYREYEGQHYILVIYTMWNLTGDPDLVNPYFNLWAVPEVHIRGKSYINQYQWTEEAIQFVLDHNWAIEEFGGTRVISKLNADRRPKSFMAVVVLDPHIPIPDGFVPDDTTVPRVLLYTDAADRDMQNNPIVFNNYEPPFRCDEEQEVDGINCFYHAEIDPATYPNNYAIPFPLVTEDLAGSMDSARYWQGGLGGDKSLAVGGDTGGDHSYGAEPAVYPNQIVPTRYSLAGMLSPVVGNGWKITQEWGPSGLHNEGDNCCWYFGYYPPEQCRCSDGSLGKTCPGGSRQLCKYCKEEGQPYFNKIGCAQHRGIDIGTPEGTPALAVFDGTVDYISKRQTSLGNYICIRSDGIYPPTGTHLCACYAHLSAFGSDATGAMLSYGTPVVYGQVIGLTGDTGAVIDGKDYRWDDHLHFEIRLAYEGQRCVPYLPNDINPFDFLSNPYLIPSDKRVSDLLRQREALMQFRQDLETIAEQFPDSAAALLMVSSEVDNSIRTIEAQLIAINPDLALVFNHGEPAPTISLSGGAYRLQDPPLVIGEKEEVIYEDD